MFTRIFKLPMLAIALIGIGAFVGCTPNDQVATDGDTSAQSDSGHDPHDVPLTDEEIAQLKADTAEYDAAIEHIQKYQATIETETTEGEPAKAHRALDNLDIVLERLPAAAQNSGVPKAKWQTVNETAQNLRDLFNQIHAQIDAGDAPDYGAVADEIAEGIDTLAAIGPEQSG